MVEPLTIRAKFEGEVRRDVLLQPGMRIAFVHPDGDVEYLVILSGDELIHELDKAALERLLQSVADPRQVTWNIEASGIKALTRTQLEKMN